MRELSACDFCDGEAAGVYEVVPGDIPGVSAHRMVLCDDCRDSLSEIVDPLLEAGRRGGRQGRAAGEADPDAAKAPESEAGTGPSSSNEAEPSAADGRAKDDRTADATDGSNADGDATTQGGASVSESGAGETPAGETPTGETPTGETPTDESSKSERTAAASGGANTDSVSSAETAAADSRADSEGPATSGGQQVEQNRIERPPNYGKVVRLVENREAGIPRADLVSLASSAYGISTDEVEQAIETALTEGRFRETAEGLETT